MTGRNRLLTKGIAILILFLFLKAVIGQVALSSFSKILIDAEFDHDDIVDVFYGSNLAGGGFRKDYRKRSSAYQRNVRSVGIIHMGDHVARRIRLDTGEHAGTVKLFSITLTSHFGPDIRLDARDIFNRFAANKEIAGFTLQPDHVLIISRSNDPFIVLRDDLVIDNEFLATTLPLIIAVLLVIVIGRIPFKTLPAWSDITTKVPSTGVNFAALDGVRGFATLLVLAQHTGIVRGSGYFGVLMFFFLSGFLLTTPFVHRPDRALSYAYMSHYLVRRLKRILPMYFTMITITILFLGKIDVAIRHYLFLQANGHYWTVAQEMLFYLILPLVMAVNALLFKHRRLLAIIFLAVSAALALRLLTIHVIPLYGNNVTLRPLVGVFLMGVMGALVFAELKGRFPEIIARRRVRQVASGGGLLLLAGCLILSDHLVGRLALVDGLHRPGWFSLAAGSIIILTLLAEGTTLHRLMAWLPLRAIGLVSFSFYLLHPTVISCVRNTTLYFFNYYPTGPVLFLTVGIVTYLLSIFTYTYIERPFIKTAAPKESTNLPGNVSPPLTADASLRN